MGLKLRDVLDGKLLECVFDEPDARHVPGSDCDVVTRVVSRTYHIDPDGPETDYYNVTYKAIGRRPEESRSSLRKLRQRGCGGQQYIDDDRKGKHPNPFCLACRADLSDLHGDPTHTIKGKYPEIID